jgi:hypothetical protein
MASPFEGGNGLRMAYYIGVDVGGTTSTLAVGNDGQCDDAEKRVSLI